MEAVVTGGSVEDEDAANDISAKPTLPSPTPATTSPPQKELILSSLQVESTLPPSPHQSPIAQPSLPPPQQPPSYDAEISMTLLNTLLDTVRTAQRFESSADTVMDDQEDKSKQWGKITELDADEDVTLEEVDAEKDAEVQGRLPESRAQVYHLDLEHADKVLITTATTPITTAPIPKASAPRRRRGVIIQDPEEATTASLKKGEKEIKEEDGKRKGKNLKQEEAKKQKIDEEVPIVDYQIHHEHNKPYYKIIRADGTHQLFLSFITLLRNFDREELEMLWKIVQEIFASLEPKNFFDDFLLNTLKTISEKPNVEASI
nr:hypothetical protein [Tanacetum cinerariifolium]